MRTRAANGRGPSGVLQGLQVQCGRRTMREVSSEVGGWVAHESLEYCTAVVTPHLSLRSWHPPLESSCVQSEFSCVQSCWWGAWLVRDWHSHTEGVLDAPPR